MKLLKSFLAAIVLTGMMTGAVLTASAAEIYLGDVHTDQSVNVTDVIKLQKHLHGSQPLQHPEEIAADVNHDGAVDVIDLVLVKRAALSGEWELYTYEEEMTPPPMPTEPQPETTAPTEPTEAMTDPVQPPDADDLSLSGGMQIPEQLKPGTPVIVRGIVTSEASPIVSVTVGVYDSAGTLVTGSSAEPGTLSFDLNTLDKDILFNKLTEGDYVYKVIASNSSIRNVTLDYQRFTVGSTAAQNEPITLAGGAEIPTSIAQGKAVIVRGMLSSGSPLTLVTVGIYNSFDEMVVGETVTPGSLTYDLHELDSAITFNKLTAGDYIYRVTAENERGTQFVDEQRFTVTAEDGLTYIGGILIANKSYPLPSTYNPGGLTPETQAAFNEMAAAAALEGITLKVASGFRSYSYQQQLYNNYVASYGQEAADTFSARPGYSEHQTGLAIDVNTASDAFIGTPEQLWLAAHCHEYGFIIRYPEGKQDITGYKYEPWHVRYLGKETALTVYNSGLTLEEYLGIDSVYR